jgi:hypothetical protein
MNADLQLGLLDGIQKNLTPDRGGSVEKDSVTKRAQQLQMQYNMADRLHPYNCSCGDCGLGYYA